MTIMSRDHYKGPRKKRAALIGANGDLEALQKGGDVKVIYGTAVLVAGTVTVSDSRISADSYAIISGKHPYPLLSGTNWGTGDGFLTVSGTGDNAVAYQVIL